MRKSRVSGWTQRKLVEHFVAGTTARTAAGLAGVNKTTAAYYCHRLRELVYQAVINAAPFAGEIEADEIYFGAQRKGRRGRGAAGTVPVFGLLKRGGKVYAVVIADGQSHINGIENFWNQAKWHLRKFNGAPKAHFLLFLKECEWRFNNPNPKNQLQQPNQWFGSF